MALSSLDGITKTGEKPGAKAALQSSSWAIKLANATSREEYV